jgi:hypothetical protein
MYLVCSVRLLYLLVSYVDDQISSDLFGSSSADGRFLLVAAVCSMRKQPKRLAEPFVGLRSFDIYYQYWRNISLCSHAFVRLVKRQHSHQPCRRAFIVKAMSTSKESGNDRHRNGCRDEGADNAFENS